MTAPFAKTGIVPVHGIAPFVVEQPGVIADPNDHFVRSLWTYDFEADNFPDLVASFRRVGTLLSGIEQGDQPGTSIPIDLSIFGIGADNPRSSRLSTRFTITEDVFEDTVPPTDEADEYDESIFLAIIAPVTRVIEPKDWVLVASGPTTALALPIPQVADLDYRARNFPSNEDVSQEFLGGLFIDNFAPGAIPTSLTGNPVVPALFIGDGSDGNPPEILANGRTPAEQLAYIQKNPAGIYMGFAFGEAGTITSDEHLITASIAHSIAMVNG